jgi:DNA-binding transcriptional ArsR family regulator
MTSEEEIYSTIFASLKHPVRRRILRMLSEMPRSFSEVLEALGISSSHLTYHLESLGELVSKMENGKYKLSTFGEAAVTTMSKVEETPKVMRAKPILSLSLKLKSLLALLMVVIVVLASASYMQYQSLNGMAAEYEPLKELSELMKKGDLLQSQYTLRYKSNSYIDISSGDSWYCVTYIPYDNSTLNAALTVSSILIPGYIPITVKKGDALALASNETAPIIQSLNTTMSGKYSLLLASKGWYTISLVGSIEKWGDNVFIISTMAPQGKLDCWMSFEIIHAGKRSPFIVAHQDFIR